MEDLHDSNPNQQKNIQSKEMTQVHSDDHAIEESLLLNELRSIPLQKKRQQPNQKPDMK